MTLTVPRPADPPRLSNRPDDRLHRRLLSRLLTREVLTFLLVGGTGYVVDVAAFSALRLLPHGPGPVLARVLAALLAIAVTYQGNRRLTWRGATRHARRTEEGLFLLLSLVGLGISVVCLVVSHDVLGLRSVTADNISANVVGLGLGTAFRFWSYRRFVFTPAR